MRKSLGKFLIPLLLALSAVASFWSGFLSFFSPGGLQAVQPPAQAEQPEDFEVFWETWHIVEESFDGSLPTPQEVTYGAIRGMLGALDDPNTFFNEPPARQAEEERLQGRHGGVGLEDPDNLSLFDGQLTVVAPLEGSPAARAGILPGDLILAIDLTPTKDLSLEEAISLLRGTPGSTVVLTIARSGSSEPLVFHPVREEIETPTVTFEIFENNIGYVKISLFGESTGQEITQALQELEEQGAEGFVLDLRDNPGGIVESAVEAASQFIPSGIILYQMQGNGEEQEFTAISGGLATQSPLVVLINGGTASAAEIVAGALQDHDRAELIGETTFGKGTVQNIHELSDGSSIHVTFAYWLTPDRHQIEGLGLTPDIQVTRTSPDETDPQLARALLLLRAELITLPYSRLAVIS